MSFFGKNIKKIRGVKGLSQQAFAEIFNLKRPTLGAYEEGRSEPKISTIIMIANYFSIKIDDLIRAELTVNKLLQFKENLALESEMIDKEVFASVPCIRSESVSEYIKFYNKKAFVNDLATLKLPLNTNGIYRGFTVVNLEMTSHDKGLYPKDVVVGEFIQLNDIKTLNNGVMVLILVKDELVLRRLYIVNDEIALKADHKNIENKVYKISDVKELWEIRYVFLKRLPEFNDVLEDKLMFLEQEFVKFKNKL